MLVGSAETTEQGAWTEPKKKARRRRGMAAKPLHSKSARDCALQGQRVNSVLYNMAVQDPKSRRDEHGRVILPEPLERPAGLAGLAEIAGRRDQSIEHRLKVDRAKFRSSQGLYAIQAEFAPDTIPAGLEHALEPGELLDCAIPVRIFSPRDYRHYDQITDSEHGGLLAYQSESQEKAEREYEAKLEKRRKKLHSRAVRAKVAQVTETDEERKKRLRAEADGRKFVELHCALSADAEDRLDSGFFFPGGRVAGDLYDAFEETLLRGRSGSPSLFRWLQVVSRAKGMRVGSDKEAVLRVLRKALGLDAPYIQLDPRFARVIAIDLDGVFASIHSLYKALLAIFGARMMPNLIVGRHNRSGQFSRPHLIWFLQQRMEEDGTVRDSSVWLDVGRRGAEGRKLGDKRCRKKIVGFYRQVIRGLKMLLLPLGADAGFHNVLKPKNPIAPFWTTAVANDDYWPTLTDFFSVSGFRLSVTDDELREEADKLRCEADGGTRSQSNLLWNAVGKHLEQEVRFLRRVREANFVIAALRGEGPLTVFLQHRIRHSVESELLEELKADDEGKVAGRLEKVLERRCRFAAQYCLSRKGDAKKGRGRDRDVFNSVADPKERRRQAGGRSLKQKHAVSMWNFRKELHCAPSAGPIRED